MIDFCTVVFQEELPVLRVQAQSIDRYCSGLGLKNIYVLVNDSDSVLDQIDKTWWGQYQNQVQIIPRSVFSTSYVENGWISQQVLKILGASLSYNTWSMVLDAKTLVTDYLSSDMFVTNFQQLTLGIQPIAPVFFNAGQIASDLFGVPVTHVASPAGVPFFFHNHTVRQMIVEIESLTQQSFPKWFQQQGMLTEFILYTGFVQYKHKDLKKIYLNRFQKTLCNNICHSEVRMFDRKLQAARDSRTLTIGVHRHAWTQLTQQQQQAYVDYLVSLGLNSAQQLI
jgi:hypothetical protein